MLNIPLFNAQMYMKSRFVTYLFLVAVVLLHGCLGPVERTWDYGIEEFKPCVRFEGERVVEISIDTDPVFDVSVCKTFPVGETNVGMTPFSKKEIVDAGYRYLPPTEYTYPEAVMMDESMSRVMIPVTFDFTQPLDASNTYAVGFHLVSSSPDLPVSDSAADIVIVIKVGESGSRSNPWLIYTVEDMLQISSRLIPYKEVSFRLMNDIDMAGVSWVPLDPTGERPIFFEGGGHTVKNLTCVATINNIIEGPSFFAYLWGTCQNLTFVQPRIISYYKKAGVVAASVGLVGWGRDHAGHLINVHVKGGSVVHHAYNSWVGWTGQAGGIAGELCFWNSTIEACTSSASVSSDYCAGGLVGQANNAARISKCSSSGNVTVSSIVAKGVASQTVFLDPSRHGAEIRWGIAGGLVGVACNVAIDNCYSTGNVTTTDPIYGFAGGLVGMAYMGLDKLDCCYSTSSVAGSAYAGGIVGTNGDYESGDNHVTRCLALNRQVQLRGRQYPGRICGRMNAGTQNGKASYGRECYALAGMPLYYGGSQVFRPDETPLSQFAQMNTEMGPQLYQGLETDRPLVTARDVLRWDPEIWDFSGQLPELILY